ncbi:MULTISPECIES: class I SAM-dependent methyltransferase [unclassified Micromonospora]|uniref:class I SAM-dependent methyltransferase n=1 Tax=unclassified Micromonospora TaxID=2617518 RepID=UPI003A86B55D
MSTCRVCSHPIREFFDFERQPLSSAFPRPGELDQEYFFRLAVGMCESCTLVQLIDAVPPERAHHRGYPYHSAASSVMCKHFEQTARRFLETDLTGADPFVVEIGANDGVMLRTCGDAGVRHLAVEPSGAAGVRAHRAFFDVDAATRIRDTDGTADVVYAANTICGVTDLRPVFEGLDVLLAPDGVFVFEDPYLGEIIERTSFDQIYDEHVFFFTVRAVGALATRYGFELVDIERLPVHGGQIRYTIARPGRRAPSPTVADALRTEQTRGLAELATLERFAARVQRIRDDLVALLHELRAGGARIVGYGATAKSSTMANYCGIGPDLIPFVCDTTPAKQGRLTPGSHIPVRPVEAFADPYPDFALLFAWNHAEEIMAKERAFREAGGQWILYVPQVHIV